MKTAADRRMFRWRRWAVCLLLCVMNCFRYLPVSCTSHVHESQPPPPPGVTINSYSSSSSPLILSLSLSLFRPSPPVSFCSALRTVELLSVLVSLWASVSSLSRSSPLHSKDRQLLYNLFCLRHSVWYRPSNLLLLHTSYWCTTYLNL